MLLQAISGIVTIGLLVLSGVVGVRLLRLGRSDDGGGDTVRLLGVYFLLHGTLATGLSVATYVGWSSAELQLPELAARALNGSFFVASTIGVTCLLLFTQRTFRPASATGRSLAGGLAMVMAVSAIVLGASEGFAIRVINGPAYWTHFAARVAAWTWVAIESFGDRSRQPRRHALGRADPKVSNPILLWGLWAALFALLAFADPVARVWYVLLAESTTAWVPEVGRPIIAATVPIACALNAAGVVLMVLTFFPMQGYRRWLLARHAARAGDAAAC
jgi:hypothetical protein